MDNLQDKTSANENTTSEQDDKATEHATDTTDSTTHATAPESNDHTNEQDTKESGQSEPKAKKEKKYVSIFGKSVRRRNVILTVFLAVLILIGATVGPFIYGILVPKSSFNPSRPQDREKDKDYYGEALSQADMDMIGSSDIVNVLLIGVDHAPERDSWNKYFYSDVMLVLALNFKENRVDMISLPRDTYAKIYNVEGKYKLNSSFYWGTQKNPDEPWQYVVKSCEWVLGNGNIPIDYYLGVDMPALKTLVDAIGGVDFDVDVPLKMQGRTYKQGMQHLDGQGVLDYFRIRKGIDNDIGRVGRQKKLLLAIFEQLKKGDMIYKVPGIIMDLSDQVHTNLTLQQLFAMAVFGTNLETENIEMYHMPGRLQNIYNWNYFVMNQKERIALIKDIYGVEVPYQTEYDQGYCSAEWASMEGKGYISIWEKHTSTIKGRGESWKFTEEEQAAFDSIWPRFRAEASKSSPNVATYKELKDQFRKYADIALSRHGISEKWFINENPGLPRLTGKADLLYSLFF